MNPDDTEARPSPRLPCPQRLQERWQRYKLARAQTAGAKRISNGIDRGLRDEAKGLGRKSCKVGVCSLVPSLRDKAPTGRSR